MDTKKCSKCGRILSLTEFYSRGGGRYRSECKECHKNYVKSKYNERKDNVNDIKSNMKCQKCGDDRFYVLDFHHKDPSQKDFNIARITSNNNHMDAIEAEIAKCVVLCSNCHREFHYMEKHFNTTLDQYLL